MKKGGSGQFLLVMLALVVGFAAFSAVIFLGKKKTPVPAVADVGAQTVFTFSENFSSTDFLDAAATTADWNTSLQTVRLSRGTGALFAADDLTRGFDNLTKGQFPLNIPNWFDLAFDPDGRPVAIWMSDFSTPTPHVRVAHWTGSTWTGFSNNNPDGNDS